MSPMIHPHRRSRNLPLAACSMFSTSPSQVHPVPTAAPPRSSKVALFRPRRLSAQSHRNHTLPGQYAKQITACRLSSTISRINWRSLLSTTVETLLHHLRSDPPSRLAVLALTAIRHPHCRRSVTRIPHLRVAVNAVATAGVLPAAATECAWTVVVRDAAIRTIAQAAAASMRVPRVTCQVKRKIHDRRGDRKRLRSLDTWK